MHNLEHKYTALWLNTIDDDMVTVCARAVDDGRCDSLLDMALIEIDSTRPTVTNPEP